MIRDLKCSGHEGLNRMECINVTFNVSKAVPRVTKGGGLATPRHKQKKSLGGGIVRD